MTSGIAEHTRMRAAVLTGPGRFTIEEVARRAPGSGEVVFDRGLWCLRLQSHPLGGT